MNVTIHPGALRGAVRVPASKSAAHRALICAALADGPSLLGIDGLNDDIAATMACLRALGASITPEGERWRVVPGAAPAAAALDCGESGSTLRFLIPVAAALGVKARFTGRGRLPERPNRALTDALRAHGARIDSDRLPMNVAGPLSGGAWTLPGDVSSQYITGLMFALPLLRGDSAIALTTKLESAGYVDMTIRALSQFGVDVQPSPGGWRIPGGQAYRTPGTLSIEGDWSSAAFWIAANAMGADIRVEGLSEDTAQGDRAMEALVGRPEIDVGHVPDLVPALAAAAATLPRDTVITGAARLRLKESDRLQAVADMLAAVGGRAAVTPDGLIVEGGRRLHGGTVDGANDHRIVMAAAILATRAGGPVTITGAQAVSKSYPEFFRHFESLGGKIDVESAGR